MNLTWSAFHPHPPPPELPHPFLLLCNFATPTKGQIYQEAHSQRPPTPLGTRGASPTSQPHDQALHHGLLPPLCSPLWLAAGQSGGKSQTSCRTERGWTPGGKHTHTSILFDLCNFSNKDFCLELCRWLRKPVNSSLLTKTHSTVVGRCLYNTSKSFFYIFFSVRAWSRSPLHSFPQMLQMTFFKPATEALISECRAAAANNVFCSGVLHTPPKKNTWHFFSLMSGLFEWCSLSLWSFSETLPLAPDDESFYLFIFFFPFRTSVHLHWAALCCAATNWIGMRSKTFSCAFYISSRACQRVGQPVSVIAIAQITEPLLSLLMIVSPFHHLRGPFCILEQSSSIRPNGLLYINRVSIEIDCLFMTKLFNSNRKIKNKCFFSL